MNWLKYSFPMVGLGLLMFVGSAADVEAGSHLSKDSNNYFKYDGGSFTHYLELRPDGSYRRVVRGRLYVEERDKGKWQQNNTGKLLLRSDQHFQNISSGALLVSMWHRDRLKTLPDLQRKIQVFLKAHRAKEFPTLDVERIRETDTGVGLDAKIGDITVLGAKRVNRSDLEKLSSKIDTFLSAGEKNLFTLVPLEYKGATVFVEDNRAGIAKAVIADELAGGADSVKAAAKHGYQKIDAAQFNEEMKAAPPMVSQSEVN
ncbi:MAG: hypothetical protein OEY86_08005 [Nitrospira sp.]|nr:hypothetical protein [Nitrospira sp.]